MKHILSLWANIYSAGSVGYILYVSMLMKAHENDHSFFIKNSITTNNQSVKYDKQVTVKPSKSSTDNKQKTSKFLEKLCESVISWLKSYRCCWAIVYLKSKLAINVFWKSRLRWFLFLWCHFKFWEWYLISQVSGFFFLKKRYVLLSNDSSWNNIASRQDIWPDRNSILM